jgi:hypothetical protein
VGYSKYPSLLAFVSNFFTAINHSAENIEDLAELTAFVSFLFLTMPDFATSFFCFWKATGT